MNRIRLESETLLNESLLCTKDSKKLPALAASLESLLHQSKLLLSSLPGKSGSDDPVGTVSSVNAYHYLQKHGIDPYRLQKESTEGSFKFESSFLEVEEETISKEQFSITPDSMQSAEQFIEENNDLALNQLISTSQSIIKNSMKFSMKQITNERWKAKQDSLVLYDFSAGSSCKDLFASEDDPYAALQLSYVSILRKFNEGRLKSWQLADEFRTAAQSSCLERRYEAVLMLWKYLGELSALFQESPNPSKSNSDLIVMKCSQSFLERLFLERINSTLAQHPRLFRSSTTNSSTVLGRICCFARISISQLFPDTTTRLDFVMEEIETPFWASLYYLLRVGFLQEALDFSNKHFQFLSTKGQTWVIDGISRIISKQSQVSSISVPIECVSCGDDDDPFKRLIVSLFSSHLTAPKELLGKTECYLWFQLRRASIQPGPSLQPIQSYFQSLPKEYFGSGTNGSLIYSFVHLLLGLNSSFIECLVERTEFKVDAVHFAIVISLLTGFDSGKGRSVLEKVCVATSRRLVKFDSELAVQYILVLREQLSEELFIRLLGNLVAESPNYGQLVGGIDERGLAQPGYLQHLSSFGSICIKAAEQLEHSGSSSGRGVKNRFQDCISLYHLGNSYSKVVQLLLVEGRLSILHQRLNETIQFVNKFNPLLELYSQLKSDSLDTNLLNSLSLLFVLCKFEISFSQSNFKECIQLYNSQLTNSNQEDFFSLLMNQLGIALVEWLLVRLERCYLAQQRSTTTTTTPSNFKSEWTERSRSLLLSLTNVPSLRENISNETFGTLCQTDLLIQK